MAKLIDPQTRSNIIEYFLSHNNNTSKVIAKHFDVHIGTVNYVLDQYYKKKMDAKNSSKRLPAKNDKADSSGLSKEEQGLGSPADRRWQVNRDSIHR